MAKKSAAATSHNAIHLTLPETSFKMYDAEPPSLEIETNKEEMLKMYTQMNIIRRIEMASDGLYKSKKIRGFCHLSTGEVSNKQAGGLAACDKFYANYLVAKIGSCCSRYGACNYTRR